MVVGYDDIAAMEDVYARAAEVLKKSGVEVHEFFRVSPDPKATVAEEGADAARQAGAEMIIGLGGGSVLDAAKGIAALVSSGGSPWDYTQANPECRALKKALPIIAVPTTAGTGAEVTSFAVFTHEAADTGLDFPLKASIFDPAIYPRVAVIDPDLAVGSPPRLTAGCGADSLGHALEACLSRGGNPMTAALGAHAGELLLDNLAAAVRNPDDAKLREPLAVAAMLAGVAFGTAGVTAAHSIAQALGALLHLPHGEAVAVALPPCLKFNAEKDAGKMSAFPSAERVAELFDQIGLPRRAPNPSGEKAEELAERIADMAVACEPMPIKLNPRKINRDQLLELIAAML